MRSIVLDTKDSSGCRKRKIIMGIIRDYYDFQALVVVFVIAGYQVVDIGAIAADAFACNFDGFQVENLALLSKFMNSSSKV